MKPSDLRYWKNRIERVRTREQALALSDELAKQPYDGSRNHLLDMLANRVLHYRGSRKDNSGSHSQPRQKKRKQRKPSLALKALAVEVPSDFFVRLCSERLVIYFCNGCHRFLVERRLRKKYPCRKCGFEFMEYHPGQNLDEAVSSFRAVPEAERPRQAMELRVGIGEAVERFMVRQRIMFQALEVVHQNRVRALGLKKFIWEHRLHEKDERSRPPRAKRWPSMEELEADRREVERKRSAGLKKKRKAKGKRGAGKRHPPRDVDLDTLPSSEYKKYSGKRR